MADLWDPFVLWLMWLTSTLKASSFTLRTPPPPPSAAADLQDEWGVSSMLIWQSVPFVLYTAPPPPFLLLLLLTPAALQPAHSQLQTLFFFGERDRLKCPVQPTAAAPGPHHSSAQRRREGRGLGAPLCGAPPVVLCSLCPLRRVLAGAFVWVLCRWGCAEDWGRSTSTFSHLMWLYRRLHTSAGRQVLCNSCLVCSPVCCDCVSWILRSQRQCVTRVFRGWKLQETLLSASAAKCSFVCFFYFLQTPISKN